MNDAFHFLRPAWLLAIPLFWLLAFWHHRARQRGGVWTRVIDAALAPFVLNESGRGGITGTGAVLALAGSVALLALAGPTWERVPVPVFRTESALVIALDLSASMNAEDVEPSRLALAKFKINDLLKLRRGGQTALLVYAAQSFVVTPLTDDTTTLLGHLQGLDTSIMPSQGSEPAAALEQAAQLLKQASVIGGHVLLVTDGADGEPFERAQAALAKRDYSVSILGIGTLSGAPIPDSSGGFAHRADGEIIMSALADRELKALAAAGGGLYLDLSVDDSEVRRLQTFLEARQDDQAQQLDDLASSQWREFGPWLLLALLPLAACGFRRGLIVGLALAVTLPAPQTVQAGWFQTDDQAAAQAFESGDFDAAAERFTVPEWRAAARYRDGDYEDAVAGFADRDDALAHYNRGNALARLGRFDEAIAAYDSALERAPEHADAEHNKALLEKLLSEQQPPPPSDQGQSDQEDQGDKDKKQDQQQSGEDQQGGGQTGDEADQEMSDANSMGGSERDDGEQAENESQGGDAENEQQRETGEEQEQAEADTDQASAEQTTTAMSESDAEREQATEQWLRQIPDDPGGLLRRKFQYQYKQRYGNKPYEGNRW